MNQAELITAVSEEAGKYYDPGVSKIVAEAVLKAFGNIANAQLKKGEEITLPGIGKLFVANVAERQGHNPKTKEPLTIAAHKAPKFKAAKALKDAVNS